jgi:hypothetical protein
MTAPKTRKPCSPTFSPSSAIIRRSGSTNCCPGIGRPAKSKSKPPPNCVSQGQSVMPVVLAECVSDKLAADLPRANLSLAVLSRETRSSPLIKRQLTALRTRAPIAATNFKFAQTCGHLFEAGRPMPVYAVPAVIRLRLVITAITTPLRRRGRTELASLDCTSKDCAPTIERRTHISRFDDANERCKVSNQSSRLSVLFPSMRPHSMYNGI